MSLMKYHKGVGLVEVLAALFVLSVGLLGIAGLQAQGIRAGHSATLRSLAVIKSIEMVERMRANPDGIRLPNSLGGTTSYTTALTDTGTLGNCDDTDAVGPATDCTPANLASHDIFMWKQSLVAAFPNMTAQGSIIITLGGLPWNSPTDAVITVQWIERGQVQNYTTQIQFVRACPNTPCV